MTLSVTFPVGFSNGTSNPDDTPLNGYRMTSAYVSSETPDADVIFAASRSSESLDADVNLAVSSLLAHL